ncbi:DUF3253 domain-containing protein [Algoriphagus sp. CAU 1675]|uniref:DUF3253 domain-containing protein n=1 Tax=Algoriphagus sp. CAU 1675 TaxID=3032597 RepID=UPI0023DBFD85|nr:DUF3253 domain-containing protein [Algoriphagus sp. CAU 1675]MDF2158033.1 DUF3253 domain-containing protein [Algoriphagus sp. CAU 1675]
MDILETAILEMCRKQKGKSFCPSEVVQQMFPEDWSLFMEDVLEAMMGLYRRDRILVTQNGEPVSRDRTPEGPVRISNP